jgi:hypothetical protein
MRGAKKYLLTAMATGHHARGILVKVYASEEAHDAVREYENKPLYD